MAADRDARLRAGFDQMQAEGNDMANDPEIAAAMEAWITATERAVRTLLRAGVPHDGILSAVLGPTAELVIKVRDESGGAP